MRTTDPEFSVPCPSPEDYAALPLYMQMLAEKIEADHVALRARISAAYRPKFALWSRSVSAISSGSSTTFTFDAGHLVFSNFLKPDGTLPTLSTLGNTFPQEGMWELGWHLNATPTGAFTASSLRIFHAAVGRAEPTGVLYTTLANASRYVVTTSTAGGDFWGNTVTFLVPFDFDRVSTIFRFEHTNAASTVALTTATAWVRYVGTTDPIEVVS